MTEKEWKDAMRDEGLRGHHPPQEDFAGGKAASSKVPALHLIPTAALVSLAKRFELGIERKGDKSWNANSDNQEVLHDVEFLVDRCGHIMLHAARLRDKLRDGDIAGILADDDAGAIGWGAAFLACAVAGLLERNNL